MDITTTWARRALVAAAIVALVPVPERLATAATQPSVAADVAAYLAGYPGSHLVADDSSATKCIGSGAQPIAYRDDRIVIRSGANDANALKLVNDTLIAHQRPDVRAVSVERITLPQPEGQTLLPILSVTLTHGGEAAPVVALARWLHGGGTPAAPDYALSPTSGPTGMWPSGFPVPADPKDLPIPRTNGTTPIGTGVTIWLYDTGQASPTLSNPTPNVSRLTTGDTETPDADGDGIVDQYFGLHSIAIGSVLNTIAPGATVKLAKITEPNGIPTDVSAARRMAMTLKQANAANAWPDLIVEPFGSSACDRDPLHPGDELVPIGLEAVSDAVDRIDQAMEVASAGNRGESRRFYPAAFPSVLSVGALDTTADADGNAWTSPSRSGPAASFSNFGSWVKWWAPGVNLVTTHAKGLRFEATGKVIDGTALISGSSFSAPNVVGYLAQEMAANGWSADVARTKIEASGVKCSARLGGGRAVALAAMTSSPTTRAAVGTTSAC
jgi:hypothetical protein